jgi:hypothetical protein
MAEELKRELTEFELSLLKDAMFKPYPTGGVLDETLEMLCNSYGLLEHLYTDGLPMGAWAITNTGRMVIELAAANARVAELEDKLKWSDVAAKTADEVIAKLEAENAELKAAIKAQMDKVAYVADKLAYLDEDRDYLTEMTSLEETVLALGEALKGE